MTADATERTTVRLPRVGWLSVARRRVRLLPTRLHAVQLLSDAQLVLKIVTAGTLFLVTILTLLLALSVFVFGNDYVLPRFIVSLGIFGYVVAILYLIHRRLTRSATGMLLAFYALLGVAILLIWGINVPTGALILGFVIILSGILLGARWILPVTGMVVLLLISVQLANDVGVVTPDTSSLALPSNFLDVTGYSTIFIIIAIVTWLAGRRMEQSLAKALRAEADLEEEKNLLAVRLEERTQSLRESQLEEMRQLYRFAELGQLGTVVLHDLANNLTALTLDIDDIEQQSRSTGAVKRARESITYLDNMIAQARRQLRHSDKPEIFDACTVIAETMIGLEPKARRARVKLEVEAPAKTASFYIKGDPLRFSQVLTILVTNAIEACGDNGARGDARVSAEVVVSKEKLLMVIIDTGVGISPDARKLLFTPFRSTKPSGMGIGLFIAHEIVERHFGGTIGLDPSITKTKFIVSIPKHHE